MSIIRDFHKNSNCEFCALEILFRWWWNAQKILGRKTCNNECIKFFQIIWESLIDADKLYDKLANYNEELDAILSSDLNDGIVDHWRYIESLVKQKFDDLVSQLNYQFYTNRTCFTISDETCIARILHPIRQEFGKFQNKMQQVMTQNQSATQ